MSQNHVVSSSSQSQSQPRKGVALVTGASRGIGLGIALRLADDGYDIAANGETSTSELAEAIKKIEEKGRRALAIPGDVSEESVVRDMIKRTVSTLGRLDVVRTAPFCLLRWICLPPRATPLLNGTSSCRHGVPPPPAIADGSQCWNSDVWIALGK